MKSNNAKSLAFDAALLTYSSTLVIYLAWLTLHWVDGSIPAPNQEFSVPNMGPLTLCILGILLTSTAVIQRLRRLNIATPGTVLFHRSYGPTFSHSFWGVHLTITTLLTLTVSLLVTEFSFRELADPDGLNGALRLFSGLTHANLSLLPTAIIQIIETIFIAFLATALALPFAFTLAFLSAKNVMTGPTGFALYALLRTLLNVVRSVEPLIWALIFTVWVGIGPFAGMLALMLHTVAALAKQFSEIVEDVPQGPVDGIRATGAGTVQVIWFGVVPQVMLPFISFSIYRWDTNVRMATVIGLVGGGGIGTLLIKYQGQAMWPEVGCIILVIAIAVWLMDAASAYIREALR